MTQTSRDNYAGNVENDVPGQNRKSGAVKSPHVVDDNTKVDNTKLTTSPENVSKTSSLPKDSQKADNDPGDGAD
ncbi:MAG: hypothetical protein U1E36_09880 [Rickettsiales bacterium]